MPFIKLPTVNVAIEELYKLYSTLFGLGNFFEKLKIKYIRVPPNKGNKNIYVV